MTEQQRMLRQISITPGRLSIGELYLAHQEYGSQFFESFVNELAHVYDILSGKSEFDAEIGTLVSYAQSHPRFEDYFDKKGQYVEPKRTDEDMLQALAFMASSMVQVLVGLSIKKNLESRP